MASRLGSIVPLTALAAGALLALVAVPPALGQSHEPVSARLHAGARSLWSLPAAPAGSAPALQSVSSVSPDLAYAVGLREPGGRVEPVAQRWDGRAWSDILDPSTLGRHAASVLWSVAATSDHDAWAVGQEFRHSGSLAALALHWTALAGTWCRSRRWVSRALAACSTG